MMGIAQGGRGWVEIEIEKIRSRNEAKIKVHAHQNIMNRGKRGEDEKGPNKELRMGV